MMNSQPTINRPWTQEPLVWMIIAIPFSAVIMGVIMITLAIQSDSGLVVDDYYKNGKEINRVLARDQRAFELGLSAELRLVSLTQIQIKLNARQAFDLQQSIALELIHTTRPGWDQHLKLTFVDGILNAEIEPLLERGRWNLFLQTSEWRLTGLLQLPQRQPTRLVANYSANYMAD